MAQADELLLARENGIPLVAVATSFQKSPQILMFHKGAGIHSPKDLNNRKVYVASGAAYWEYLKKAYKLDGAQEMAYTGSMAPFLEDKNAAIQAI